MSDTELWDRRCRSCGELWPHRAFRVLWFFTAARCKVCRGLGPGTARAIHYMRWPLGIPESRRVAPPAPERNPQ